MQTSKLLSTLCGFSRRNCIRGKFGRLQIPTLREYLEWMAEEEDLITNIELKNSVYYYGGMEEKVIDMICEYGLEDRIILSSFNNASIVLCRQSDETIAGGFLVEKYVDNAGVYARTCDVQYYHPNLEYLKEEHVRSCSQNGIGVNVWTVNEEEDMRRMKKWGVNSIITNYPRMQASVWISLWLQNISSVSVITL